jgi:hypothetical protein
VNDFLTAYLYCLHTMRGGQLSASDAMNHLLDVASGAQRAKTGVVQLLGLATGWATSVTPMAKGEPHA